MKTRLELAHDYMTAWLKSGNAEPNSAEELASFFFSVADAMLAENEKRKSETTLTTLQQTFINGVEQPRYAPCVEEWRPDWSVAPDGYDWFCVGSETNNGYFCNIEPKTFKDKYWFVGEDSIEIINHGYTGNWRDSLRKRPFENTLNGKYPQYEAGRNYSPDAWVIYNGELRLAVSISEGK